MMSARDTFLENLKRHPTADLDVQWANGAQGKRVLHAGGEVSLKPLELRTWPDCESDAAISHLAFAGIGAHTLRKCGTVGTDCPDSAGAGGAPVAYVSDFLWLGPFEVRKDSNGVRYERYGAAVYFDANRTLVMMRQAARRLQDETDP